MFLRLAKIIISIAMLVRGAEILACINCVSQDPLALSPQEQWKVYLGLSREDSFGFVDAKGLDVHQFGLETRNTTTIAVGHTFSPQAYMTVTRPYLVNKRGADQRSGWGDVMVTGRYVIIPEGVDDDWMPQIQGIVAVMDGRATSGYDYQDPAQLDVFGSGVPQWRVGVDAWHGMSDWKGGLAGNLSGPIESRRTEFGLVRNGLTFGLTATGGYGYGDRQKVLWGIIIEKTTSKVINDVSVANSASQGATVFLSGEAAIAHNAVIQLMLEKTLAIGFLKNFGRSDTVTGALVRSF